MLLTIFNLPAQTRYVDVKSLIHTKCGLKDVILDNLTSESNNTKRVTVGLAEEEDAAILVRKINGLFVEGQQLYVETVKKKAASSVMDFSGNQTQQQQPLPQQPYYQQNKFQPNYELSFAQMQQSRAQPLGVGSMGYSGLYGSAQNASANFGYPQQMQYQSAQQVMAQAMVGYDQRAPLGFSNQGNNPSVWSDQNDWNHAGNQNDWNNASNESAGNKISQQGRSGSRWENTGDSSNRPHNGEPARVSDRDRLSRFGNEAPSRDAGRSGSRRDFGRDAKSRDRGRDAPRDLGRDRDQGRNRDQVRDRDQGRNRDEGRERDHGRDRYQGRDRDQGRDHNNGRDRGRDRNAPFRESSSRNAPVRNATPREQGGALYNRRTQPPRATKRQITPPPAIYGQHVTNSSQQQGEPKPNQPWAKPQPQQKKVESNYIPANKRPKKSDDPQATVPANKPQGQTKVKKNKQADNPDGMPIRAATWRHQIASVVAKEILQNKKHKKDIPPEQLLPALKRGVWIRLEELFGGDFEIKMPDMLNIYKEKFGSHDDTEFFNQVKENLKKNGSFQAGVGEKAAPVTQKTASTAAVEKAPEAAQPGETTVTMPSYPHGDKKANKGLKKANAHIFEDETILLSKMDPDLQKAVINEMDEMAKAIASEFEGESDVDFKDFNEKAKAPLLVEDCKKMVTVNLAKRLLNIGPIMIRIYTVPKTLNRNKLAPVLADYGVVSLRKAERKKPPVHYGTCETYDDHDRLCKMDPLVIDGSTVLIKPFHLTGKAEKRALSINTDRDWLNVDRNDDVAGQEFEEMEDDIDEEMRNLITDDQDQTDDEQDVNENKETGEPDQDVEDTEMAEDEDTNGNIKLQVNEEEEENIDQNDAENTELAVKSETKTNELEENGSQPVEENTEVDNKEQTESKPTEDVNNIVEAINFTADVDVKKESKDDNSFKISEETDLEAEKDLSEVNTTDLEDSKVNIIDTIDMADLNDDDLEDW